MAFIEEFCIKKKNDEGTEFVFYLLEEELFIILFVLGMICD